MPADSGTAYFISISQTCQNLLWLCFLRRKKKKKRQGMLPVNRAFWDIVVHVTGDLQVMHHDRWYEI